MYSIYVSAKTEGGKALPRFVVWNIYGSLCDDVQEVEVFFYACLNIALTFDVFCDVEKCVCKQIESSDVCLILKIVRHFV